MQQSSETGPSNEEMRPEVQPQPQKEKCPRCDSFNTKFCYYNNYSLSQPRYFCKSCRRYWTQGGTLRNVPIGGGCRKGKRPKTISSSSAPLSQPSTETQRNALPSANDPVVITASVSASGAVETGAFSSSCYPGGGYFPSMGSIQSFSQPPIFNQSVEMAGVLQRAGVAVYSFGSEHNWSHQSFAGDPNPAVPDASMWTINDSTTSSAGNNGTTKNSNSGNCLVPNPDQWSGDLPGYGHPP